MMPTRSNRFAISTILFGISLFQIPMALGISYLVPTMPGGTIYVVIILAICLVVASALVLPISIAKKSGVVALGMFLLIVEFVICAIRAIQTTGFDGIQ
jgi:hypothetical protein